MSELEEWILEEELKQLLDLPELWEVLKLWSWHLELE
jgi:hypothetical protein